MSDAFDRSIVESTAHRPWPKPSAPWLMTQSWNSLLFAHWRVDVAEMRRAVPDAFDLDLFDGEAWLGGYRNRLHARSLNNLRCGANGIVVMGKIDSGLEAAGSGLSEVTIGVAADEMHRCR
jgi:Uncharacterized conserved protein (COG2071)